MTIMSLRVDPFARVLAIIYGLLGLTMVPASLLMGTKEIVLPIGFLAPLFHFNLNFHIALPTHFLTGVLSAAVAALCYAVSGWLTGAIAILVFNFVALRMGGIDASSLVKDFRASEQAVSS